VYDRARECSSSLIISAIAIAALALPVVVLGPRAGLEILHPLAVVLLGGLVSSLVVALFVVPAAYLHLVPQQEGDAPPDDSEEEPQPIAAGSGTVL
jgi:Cu/Ag efflux pump CusA